MAELRQLRIFIAVAEELNFTRAAERLFLTQQAVSKAVRGLERELGVTLLQRNTHDVRLTDAGTALLDSGPDALAAAERAFDRARRHGRGLAGEIRLGVTAAIGPVERDLAARALQAGTTDVRVAVVQVATARLGKLLRDGSIHVALTRTGRPGEVVDSAALRPTPTVLWVAADDPLAGSRAVRLAELDGRRVLTWRPAGTPFTDLLVGRLGTAGTSVRPAPASVTGTAPAAAALTAQVGDGAIALMPAGWPPGEGITAVELDEPITLPLRVLWPAGPPSPAVRRLRAALS